MDNFSDMMLRLQGVKIVEAPRVSRETIVGILREHTLLLGEIKENIACIMIDLSLISEESAGSKDTMADFRKGITIAFTEFKKEASKSSEEIRRAAEIGATFRDHMSAFHETMGGINIRLEEHQKFRAESKLLYNNVEKIAEKISRQTNKFCDFERQSEISSAHFEKKSEEIHSKMKEMKAYVVQVIGNLMISSSQVTVASSAGISDRPMILFDVLKINHESLRSLQSVSVTHTAGITTNAAAIMKKADDAILFEVDDLSKKLTKIEEFQIKEQNYGLNGLRDSCERLERNFEILDGTMQDKVNNYEMDRAMHQKYEVIVQYLKDSIKATNEDEQHFEKKIEEFQAAIKRLSNSKADRIEVSPLQEMLVKFQAVLYKMNQQNKDNQTNGNENPNFISKTDFDYFLDQKVDKNDFLIQIESLSKSIMKNRKLGALKAGISDGVRDEIHDMNIAQATKPSVFTSNSITLAPKPEDSKRRTYAQTSSTPGAAHRGDLFTAFQGVPNVDFSAFAKQERGRRDKGRSYQGQGQTQGQSYSGSAPLSLSTAVSSIPLSLSAEQLSGSMYDKSADYNDIIFKENILNCGGTVEDSCLRGIQDKSKSRVLTKPSSSIRVPSSIPSFGAEVPVLGEGEREREIEREVHGIHLRGYSDSNYYENIKNHVRKGSGSVLNSFITGGGVGGGGGASLGGGYSMRPSSSSPDSLQATHSLTDPNALDNDISDTMIKGNNGHLYYSNEKQEIVISTPGGTKNEYEIEPSVSKQSRSYSSSSKIRTSNSSSNTTLSPQSPSIFLI